MDDIGFGMLIGIQQANRLNERDFTNERARLKQQLDEAYASELVHRAQKDAVKLCIDAVVDELNHSATGVAGNKRHSDPLHVAQRIEDFVDTASSILTRISGNQLEFSVESKNEAMASGKDVGRVIAGSGLKRVQRRQVR